MANTRKKKMFRLDSQPDFEQIDHRLAFDSYIEREGSGQRKRYLRSIREEQLKLPILAN